MFRSGGADAGGRDEAHYYREERGQERDARDDPHPGLPSGDAVRAGLIRFGVAQLDRGREHEEVHYHVELRGERGHDPERAADGRHEEHDQREQRRDHPLRGQDARRHAVFVAVLPVIGEIPFAGDFQHSLGGSEHPRHDHGHGPVGEQEAHHRSHPLDAEHLEDRVEGLIGSGGEADLRGRHDQRDRERAEHAQQYHQRGGGEDRAREVAGGLLHLGHVHRRHLHAGEGDHHPREQHELVPVAEVGDERVEREADHRFLAGEQVARRHQYDHDPRRDGPGDGSGTAQERGEFYPPEVEQRRQPQRYPDGHEHEPAVGRQLRIEDVGDRRRHEGQHRGEPRQVFDPLHEDRDEAPLGAERLFDPQIDAAVFRPRAGQLRRDERGGDEEADRGRDEIEDHAVAVLRLRRQVPQRQHRRHGEHAHGEDAHGVFSDRHEKFSFEIFTVYRFTTSVRKRVFPPHVSRSTPWMSPA